MDPFSKLPIEIIQFILSFLTSREAAQTSILSKNFLQAWSTIPDLNFIYKDFHKLLSRQIVDRKQSQQVEKVRDMFINHVDCTLTRYQQHNIPLRRLYIASQIVDDKISSGLEQCLLKAKENGAKEVYIYMHLMSNVSNFSTLLQTIFALKELRKLMLIGCDLVKGVQDQNGTINCSSLTVLRLLNVRLNEEVLQKLIHSCPLIQVLILRCKGPKIIQVANLHKLKTLYVSTYSDQMVDVNAASLEFMIYQTHKSSPFMLNIEPTQSLKILNLGGSNMTDEQLHNLIAKFPCLEELNLKDCDEICKLNVSNRSLSTLSVNYCRSLMDVKIETRILNQFEYKGGTTIPSLSFASGESGERKSRVKLSLNGLKPASVYLELREFLRRLKRSDIITLDICSWEIDFDKNIVVEEYKNPEFEQVFVTVTAPSSTYSSLMEGLLWCFSPNILSVKCGSKKNEEFINYLCEELLLVEHNPNTEAKGWRNYFKQAKFEDRDDEWHPLQSWKSSEDALQNLEDFYILKLCANR